MGGFSNCIGFTRKASSLVINVTERPGVDINQFAKMQDHSFKSYTRNGCDALDYFCFFSSTIIC